MPNLISTTGLIDDDWSRSDSPNGTDTNAKLIFGSKQLKENPEYLQQSRGQLGVELDPDVEVEEILPYLDKLDLVVLRFNNFADGRAFSQSKLLRDRYKFQGKIRAVGDVIQDQVEYMRRCGFDEFEINDNEDYESVLQKFHEISNGYQTDLTPKPIGNSA